MDNGINRSVLKKGRFNLIDAIILLISVALMFVLLWVFDPFEWFADFEKQEVSVTYVVEFSAVDKELADKISHGDIAINKQNEEIVGRVIDVATEPSYEWVPSSDESIMVKKQIEGKIDLKVTITVECTLEQGIGYMTNEKQIAVGSLFDLRFDNFVGSGYCVSMEASE